MFPGGSGASRPTVARSAVSPLRRQALGIAAGCGRSCYATRVLVTQGLRRSCYATRVLVTQGLRRSGYATRVLVTQGLRRSGYATRVLVTQGLWSLWLRNTRSGDPGSVSLPADADWGTGFTAAGVTVDISPYGILRPPNGHREYQRPPGTAKAAKRPYTPLTLGGVAEPEQPHFFSAEQPLLLAFPFAALGLLVVLGRTLCEPLGFGLAFHRARGDRHRAFLTERDDEVRACG